MEILTGPHTHRIPNREVKIPPELEPYITDWAKVIYLQNYWGHTLTQSISSKFYRIYLSRFITGCPTEIFLNCKQNVIAMQFIIKGPLSSSNSTEGASILKTNRFGFLYLPKGIHSFQLETGEFEILLIELESVLLQELAEIRPEIHELIKLSRTNNTEKKLLETIPVNYMVRDIIDDIIFCQERGADLIMEFTTDVNILLNLYRKGMNDKDYLRTLPSVAYKETLLNIRDEIALDPNKVLHTLSYFSKKYNLSESTLKRIFKTYFKKSLGEFVTEECMKKADYLTKDPDMSLDDIADEVGYSERSGFIRAYKRFYGKTPKQSE